MKIDAQVAARFWPKVSIDPEGCWRWTGARVPGGYGSIGIGGRQEGAHRVSWALANGRWPEGWVLHRCGNRGCVRPDHLYEGDAKQNMADNLRDGTHPKAAKTHCPQGHPYDEGNTYIIPSTGHRTCKACNVEKARRRSHKLGRGPANADKTHCKRGHEFTPENTGRTSRGGRRCLMCHREQEMRRRQMKNRGI